MSQVHVHFAGRTQSGCIQNPNDSESAGNYQFLKSYGYV